MVRKGSRALQHLPASADAFVWLRLYQQEMLDLVPRGPDEPVWWTLRRPFRPLTYDAARMVFTRVNRLLGANWTLHDLRHSAAKRMVRDPHLTLADVQWVLGHAHITTTEIYTAPAPDEVISPRPGPPRAAAHPAGHASGPAGARLPAGGAGGACSAHRRSPAGSMMPRKVRDGPPMGTGQRTAAGAAAGVGASPVAGKLVADMPGAGGPGRAVAGRFTDPGAGRGRDKTRRRGLTKLLDWLQSQPGDTWQDRWLASGADAAGFGWAELPLKVGVPARRHQRDELTQRLGPAGGRAGDPARPTGG